MGWSWRCTFWLPSCHPPSLFYSRVPHHANPHDGAVHHAWSQTQSQAECDFGRLCQSWPLVGSWLPTTSFRRNSPFPTVYISDSPTSPMCNPNLILGLPCTTFWTGSTADPESGQKEKGLPKWTTYHFLVDSPFRPTDAQHPGTDDLSTNPGRLSESLCHRRRLHPSQDLTWGSRSRGSYLVQPGFSGFLHQHWSSPFFFVWYVLLDFLPSPVSDNEAFSVCRGKSNNPGDLIKGQSSMSQEMLVIKDVPALIKTALDMHTFALGQRSIRQRRGSPMGSPLSPALCLMVVSINEQIWFINFMKRWLTTICSYVTFGMSTTGWFLATKDFSMSPYEVLLDEGFYARQIVLETEPDQEFLGFMLETKPLDLIYCGPTNISSSVSILCTLYPHQKYYSVASAPVATSWSKEHFLYTEYSGTWAAHSFVHFGKFLPRRTQLHFISNFDHWRVKPLLRATHEVLHHERHVCSHVPFQFTGFSFLY